MNVDWKLNCVTQDGKWDNTLVPITLTPKIVSTDAFIVEEDSLLNFKQ
jgi:hypothetical protein